MFFFFLKIIVFFHYHLVSLCPPPPCNHHTIVPVHEPFFLFVRSLHPLPSCTLSCHLALYESLSILLVSSVCSLDKKCWWGCGERGTLLHCCWECRLVQPLWKTAWRYLKKIKNGSAFWPNNPTSWNISKGTQNTNSKEGKHLYNHCNVI